jgi:viologen exporter family transport system permease protein
MSTPTVTTVQDGAHLYRRLIGARMRAQLEYRTSFVVNLISTALITAADFLVIAVLFEHLPLLAGWSLPEVAFLYGVSGIGFAIADLVVGHIEQTSELIRTGQFDVVLLRPAGTLFQVVASDFALRRIGKALQSAVVLVVALGALDIRWDVGRVLMTGTIAISGGAIFSAVFIVGACVTFWFVGSSEFANAFTYGGQSMTAYPLNVFGPWLRRVLAYVIPLAFVAYLPGLYVLDKPDPLGLPTVFRYLSPLVAVGSLLAARAVWHFAVRHYRSTGS